MDISQNQIARRARKRGTHSVVSKNPHPSHERHAGFKKLPGAFGKVYRIAQKKNCARHPYFVYLRAALGRERSFRPERRSMINATICAVLDCLDLATGMTTKTLEQIALDLGVTACRLSRVVNEVFIAAGLMYVHADKRALDADPNFGMVWDQAHSIWFPKCLVVTDEFWRVAGADDRLMAQIKHQAEQHLVMNKHGLAKPGEILSLHEARNRRRDRAFKQAWEKRKAAAKTQRTRAKLAGLDLDERQYFIAQKLMRQRPEFYESQHVDVLQRDIWNTLHNFNLASSPPGSDSPH